MADISSGDDAIQESAHSGFSAGVEIGEGHGLRVATEWRRRRERMTKTEQARGTT